MSLIYSALNKLEQDSVAPGAVNPAVVNSYAVAEKKPAIARWVYLVLAGCVVVVLVGWGSMKALQAQFAAALRVEPVSHPAPASPVVVAAAELPLALAVVPVMTPVQPLPPALEPVAIAPAAQAKPVLAKAAPARLPVPPRPRPSADVTTEAALPAPLDPQETEQLTKAVALAIQAGKNDEAQNLLKQLAARLPPESITLLRLNAWQSMQGGDSARAMALYRQIVERMPDDESAGINLALLHRKAGQTIEARRLMGALAERHPESVTVQKYSRELGVSR